RMTWGPRTFTVYEGERATYEGFARAALTLARDMADRGVTKGDRVAIAMRNLPEWPVAFFAAALVGAIATPLNAWWTGPELEYALDDSGAKVLLVDPERLARLAPHLEGRPALEHVYVTRLEGAVADPRLSRLEDVIGAPPAWPDLPAGEMPAVELTPEDDATIFYTSGTTGKPKGALATHRNNTCNILGLVFSVARNYLRRGETPPTPQPSDPQKVGLVGIPFFHTTGCHALLLPSMIQGAKLVLMRKFDAVDAMRLIEQEKVTNAGGVPAIAWMILEHPERDKYDLSSLESVSYGGAPASPELVKKLLDAFPKSVPGTGWGMTETAGAHVHFQGEDYVNRPGSCGAALGPCEIKITDDQGNELPRGEVGELRAYGPNVLKGYWNKPEATAETFVDGWVRTGDLAKMDEEGFLFIVDRAKDMLIRGGENIYCVEVENALYEHPSIMDAAVVGRAHEVLGEEPCAVVTTKPGTSATEQELRDHVAERLAGFKVPVAVIVRDEPLPRNANGKILKTELKGLFA
ncbi:MAG TPA: class I adenylate-forming enzyme family protein, partial [Caulobacteraceae bacterium]|nr:class I adenylate-forming enzyme family protein [Caulobacteraceae bacterium]